MMIRKKHKRWIILGLVAFLMCYMPLGATAGASDDAIQFNDIKRQTEEFLQYEKTITLTSEQQAIKSEALTAIPAPCCSQFSIETCCCTCNLARSVWGLSKFLITEYGYDAIQVRETVNRWIDSINPNGFSGKACFTGGCERPFKNDGCGGMKELKF